MTIKRIIKNIRNISIKWCSFYDDKNDDVNDDDVDDDIDDDGDI